MIEIINKIEKLSLKKGDVVTVQLKMRFSHEGIEHLRVKLQRHFKDNEVIILNPEVEIKIKKN